MASEVPVRCLPLPVKAEGPVTHVQNKPRDLLEKAAAVSKARPPANRQVVKCSVSPSLSLPPLYLPLLAAMQSKSCDVIRSAAVPRPLNHVQVLHGDHTVITDNSAFQRGECRMSLVFKLSINKIYDCAHGLYDL